MDNHPIPQDVTNFQFRLIGEMTLKQFAYLGAGVVIGWLMFLLPVFFIIKLPLALAFAGLGAFLAFAPIDGRPADVALLNFIHALFTPNEYIYQQTGGDITPVHQTAVIDTKMITVKPQEKKDDNQKTYFETLPTVARAAATTPTVAATPTDHIVPTIAPPPTTETSKTTTDVTKQEQEMAQKEIELSKQLEEAKKEEQQEPQKEMAHEKTAELEQELSSILSQKQELEAQLITLKKQLEEKKQQAVTPVTMEAPKQQTERVRKIPKTLGKSVGLPIAPDVPNLICGIVKDPRGNVLPNILVEVKDAEGNPVRAFKTNALGQFASATPLLNGDYTISFEDPTVKNKFDFIDITADGTVLLPIEILSIDAREELRKELFGQQTQTMQ
ncbi:MAG: PrgI family mobile element protein [Candidatus Levyibacteriota bacterium]